MRAYVLVALIALATTGPSATMLAAQSRLPALREGASPELRTALALWSKALDVFAAGVESKPRHMETWFEEIDSKGAVVTREESQLALSYVPGKEDPLTFIEYTAKDGKDVTLERRKKAAEDDAKGKPAARRPSGEASFSATPLDPDLQGGVTLLASRRETLNGKAVVSVDYEQVEGKSSFAGTLHLDATTGFPLEAVYGFRKAPVFVAFMRTNLVYGETLSQGRSAAVVTSVGFEAEATILVIKKRFRGELRFQDYAN